MKYVIFFAALIGLFVWRLCAVAGSADEQAEEFFKEFTSIRK